MYWFPSVLDKYFRFYSDFCNLSEIAHTTPMSDICYDNSITGRSWNFILHIFSSLNRIQVQYRFGGNLRRAFKKLAFCCWKQMEWAIIFHMIYLFIYILYLFVDLFIYLLMFKYAYLFIFNYLYVHILYINVLFCTIIKVSIVWGLWWF